MSDIKISEFYKKTYEEQYKLQPRWKQIAIDEDISLNKSSRILDEFIGIVTQKAEHDFDEKMKKQKSKIK